MEKTLFTEEQRFDQLWIRLLILISWIPLGVIFGIGIYTQLILGKPWGNNPLSDKGLILTAALVFLVMGVMTLFLFSLRMITEVTDHGIRFRFPPVMLRFKMFSIPDIASYEIREYRPISEYGGWGIRQRSFTKGVAYNVKGNKGLQLTLTNGKKVLLGTQRPDALLAAMDRIMKPPKN